MSDEGRPRERSRDEVHTVRVRFVPEALPPRPQPAVSGRLTWAEQQAIQAWEAEVRLRQSAGGRWIDPATGELFDYRPLGPSSGLVPDPASLHQPSFLAPGDVPPSGRFYQSGPFDPAETDWELERRLRQEAAQQQAGTLYGSNLPRALTWEERQWARQAGRLRVPTAGQGEMPFSPTPRVATAFDPPPPSVFVPGPPAPPPRVPGAPSGAVPDPGELYQPSFFDPDDVPEGRFYQSRPGFSPDDWELERRLRREAAGQQVGSLFGSAAPGSITWEERQWARQAGRLRVPTAGQGEMPFSPTPRVATAFDPPPPSVFVPGPPAPPPRVPGAPSGAVPDPGELYQPSFFDPDDVPEGRFYQSRPGFSPDDWELERRLRREARRSAGRLALR